MEETIGLVMPTNLYGPGDNYHPENSHVFRHSYDGSMNDVACIQSHVVASVKMSKKFSYKLNL